MEDEFTQVIYGCARCHGDGHELTFRKLTHPVEHRTNGEWEVVASHWAMCPTVDEPILMAFVVLEDLEEDDAKAD